MYFERPLHKSNPSPHRVGNEIRPGTVPYKLRTAVYPSRMAPIGTKICQNAFQTIPDISFFNADKLVFAILFPKISSSIFFQESCVLEELGIFERHWQIPHRKSLPVVRLFFLYEPWRRSKRGGLCFGGVFWTKNDFSLFPFFDGTL